VTPPPATTADLTAFVEARVLTDADLRLADRLCRMGRDPEGSGASDEVLLAVALAFRAPRYGHVCVELDRVADRVAVEPQPGAGPDETGTPDPATLSWPDPAAWRRALVADRLVREPGGADAAAATPLVLDGQRLYLDRYWRYEQHLASSLIRRAAERVDEVDRGALRRGLDQLFPADNGATDDGATATTLDRQRLAAAVAVLRRLTVIAGGPGTGKTYTVTRVLALLHIEASARDPDRPLRVALAAPTGKAAARLQDSLREGLAELDLDAAVRDALEHTPSSTLHRLLGTRRDSSSRFRHDATAPLPHDVVIVDEASMVSLPLMAKLVDAIRPDARLVLLGDRDQLASVEAGAAFGDLCGPAGSRPELRLSGAAVTELEDALGVEVAAHVEPAPSPGVWDAIVRLDRFRRFGGESDLGNVAAAIQREDTEPGRAVELLRAADPDDDRAGVRLLDPDVRADASRTCETDVAAAYERYVRLALDEDPDPAAVLEALGALRVLCALRRGPDGAWAWNAAIETRLARQVPGFHTGTPWYVGRPVLVTQNDYGVRLYNGDVGVILADPDRAGRRLAVFPTSDGSFRYLSPARLPACETTFAMTIHKSQGSQFAHAVVVLPRTPSPVLTRELLYTAITRATDRTTVLARAEIVEQALARPVQRASGLQDRLWRGADG
jgi:exodeoxyribonuclease V alpha subunit